MNVHPTYENSADDSDGIVTLVRSRFRVLFWQFSVLVLSNAVLVLVIDARSVLASDSGTPLIAIMVR
jgi:hypothetical protein